MLIVNVIIRLRVAFDWFYICVSRDNVSDGHIADKLYLILMLVP